MSKWWDPKGKKTGTRKNGNLVTKKFICIKAQLGSKSQTNVMSDAKKKGKIKL